MEALLAADLADDLSLPNGPFTFLAPTNEAMISDDLLECLSDRNIEERQYFWRNHIFGDDFLEFEIRELYDYDDIGDEPMLNDETITIEIDEDDTMVFNGNSKIVQPDMIALNGIVHGIDRVLLRTSSNDDDNNDVDTVYFIVLRVGFSFSLFLFHVLSLSLSLCLSLFRSHS